MREAGSMTRPFQDLGTKNLFYVLMQLTAGMGDRQLLLQCMESVSLKACLYVIVRKRGREILYLACLGS